MKVRNMLFKMLYWYISLADKKREVLFMNYGYHDTEEKIELLPEDEVNRYSIQLYHQLAKMADIKYKNIIEIGSGRGGGLTYISKTFQPATALGIDINARAIKFANSTFAEQGLSFRKGNAQRLKLSDNSVDIVLNVESSHRYSEMNLFLDEVYRVLKPGGQFLFTDFRDKEDLGALVQLLSNYNFITLQDKLINEQVNQALKLDSVRRMALVQRLAPPFIKKHIHDFAGSVGSPTFNNNQKGNMVYFVKCLQKPFEQA